MEDIILTGDRPTGKLHLGHYVGSLAHRVSLQNSGKYQKIYVMVADSQAITDNANNIKKIKENLIEVVLDYLACGIDPEKSTIFIQSQIPDLCELTFYYLNLVTVSRLQRNPTVKQEIKMRNFQASIPAGFFIYPVSQAADITAFNANIIPVGDDQLPMIEQAKEIVKSFNSIYGETLVEPNALLPKNSSCCRLPGLDGKSKMSKSIGNCIYLSDSPSEIEKKVMSMFTDPNHLKIEDPGNTKDNPVFIYLSAFAKDEHFSRYFTEYKNLTELKLAYEKGGVGDIKVKRFLNKILQEILDPIRIKRKSYENRVDEIYEILMVGSKNAKEQATATLEKVRNSIGINYFKS